jgi:hypothetical protein
MSSRQEALRQLDFLEQGHIRSLRLALLNIAIRFFRVRAVIRDLFDDFNVFDVSYLSNVDYCLKFLS